MDISTIWEGLATDQGGRIVLLVLDGGGGLPYPPRGRTALEAATTPNLDELARASSGGLLELVGPGITPGSGPGHLSLFGYDPLRFRLGRGVLSALGIDFPLRHGDLAARMNFATFDERGRVTDRRAGRIETSLNERLCRKVKEGLRLDFDGEVFVETESEHRAVLVLRGEGLSDELPDTDPQRTGVEPNPVVPLQPGAERTSALVRAVVEQSREILAGEEPANGLLLRGFQCHQPLPTLRERFRLRGLCLAQYPMYRGVSRLLGMDVGEVTTDFEAQLNTFAAHYGDGHDFYFLHVKGTDKAGEDGDFDAKVAVIEEVDALLPRLLRVQADVLAVSADHSTPALMAAHSWHPVPVLLHSPYVRRDPVTRFTEIECLKGALGQRPGVHLMGLALANAGRLKKYGA
jgi:2,3-bisphosphoglycerate-independent phosphoglycerate mutase